MMHIRRTDIKSERANPHQCCVLALPPGYKV